jgi:hypothetical protein
MAQPPREPERPRGADAADAFARTLAERSADLGDAIDWEDEDCDQDTWRDDIDDDEMPESSPGLRGEGRTGASTGGRPQFNSFPSATKGPLLPVLTVVLPIRVGTGRPVEALQRRGRYYSLALRASSRWLMMHRKHHTAGRLELHLITEAWPLCLMAPMPSAEQPWPEIRSDLESFEVYRFLRRTGRMPFPSHIGADAHSAFSNLTRRHRDLDVEVRIKLCDRQRVLDLTPFRGDAWPPGW